MPWSIFAPIIAIVITVAATQAAVALAGAARTSDYRRFEDKSSESIARQFALPAIASTTAEELRKAVTPILDKAHKAAGAAQTVYHDAVVRSAGCLALAFLTLAVSTLPSTGLPPPIQSHWHALQLVLSWTDTIALFAVLALFFYGSRKCGPWIASRSGTEFLRQYQFLGMVFPSVVYSTTADDPKTLFEAEANLLGERAQKGEATDIAIRVERFWSARKSLVANGALGERDLTSDALLVYLQKRVVRQLGWFADSKARLEHIAERRKLILQGLYLFTAGIGVTKHVLFLYGLSPAIFQPLLLIATGISAAMTAYYFNQNLRSLIHRYNSQQRTITAWLRAFDSRWSFATLQSLTLDLAAKSEMREKILEFEDLMIDELIDWIHITSKDAIELAP